MTLPELITSLTKAFPDHRGRIEAMLGSYKRVLGHLGPDELQRVWQRTIDHWSRNTPPMPADFGEQRPERAAAESDKIAALMQATKDAEFERKRLVDRTLEHYAATLDAYAKEFQPNFRREILITQMYGTTTVSGPEIFRYCALYLIQRKAWPLACRTAETNQGFAHVELTAADWQQIREHAETRIRGWTQKAVARSAPRESDRQKAQLRQLADQWRGVTPEPETV